MPRFGIRISGYVCVCVYMCIISYRTVYMLYKHRKKNYYVIYEMIFFYFCTHITSTACVHTSYAKITVAIMDACR